MQKLFVVLFFLFVVGIAKSQNLQVEGTAPDLYVTHIVAPKENFYSVGRLYNQSPKTIAAFNNITMEKGLTIGQHVKIPLNAQNFDNTGKANAGETLIPVTHIVAKSETLFKIGTDHNISAQMLRQWNGLSSDNITPGAALVVGHLKVLNQNKGAIVSTSPVASKPEDTEVAIVKPEVPVATKPVEKAEPKKTETSAVKEELFETVTPPASTTKKEATPVIKTEPVSQPVKDEAVAVNAERAEINTTPVIANTGSVAVKEPAGRTQNSRRVNESPYSASASVEGAFAGNFPVETSQKSLNSKSGDAATFKSVSGWQDRKYYVLMNDVAPGTIIKISSVDNKVVYAKVLGSMPDMKENNGLLLRISNSAASYLGIIDPKFPVKVSYYQ